MLKTQNTGALMKNQNFRGRRTTRNKTIVVDIRDLQAGDSQIDSTYFHQNTTQIPYIPFESFVLAPKLHTQVPVTFESANSRTFMFSELMAAFRTIEKQSINDPSVVKTALKRFKTNEESAIENDIENEKARIQMEIFPKIMNNPFLRKDSELPITRMGRDSHSDRFRNRPSKQ